MSDRKFWLACKAMLWMTALGVVVWVVAKLAGAA